MNDSNPDFPSLFHSHFKQLHHFFLKRGIGREDSKDMVMETFSRAYQGWAGFRGDANPKTWLISIAVNLLHETHRAQQALKREHEPLWGDIAGEHEEPAALGQTLPLDLVLKSERTAAVQTAIAKLPPQMAQCMTLRIGQGLKYEEIAVVMKISIQTIKSHIHQAKKKLKVELSPYFTDI